MFASAFTIFNTVFVSMHMLLNPTIQFSTSCETWITERPGTFDLFYLKEYLLQQNNTISMVVSLPNGKTNTPYQTRMIYGLKFPYDIIEDNQSDEIKNREKVISIAGDHSYLYLSKKFMSITPVPEALRHDYLARKWWSPGRMAVSAEIKAPSIFIGEHPNTKNIFIARSGPDGIFCSTKNVCKESSPKDQKTELTSFDPKTQNIITHVDQACAAVQSKNFQDMFDDIKAIPAACLPQVEKEAVLRLQSDARRYCLEYEQNLRNKLVTFMQKTL